MIDAMLVALQNLFSPTFLLPMMLGIAVGIVVGIVPGLSGIAGMTLLLPFVTDLDPAVGLTVLVGVMSVTATSDTFPSILMGVPGSAGSQATVLDGYAMTKRGEGARALGAGFSASAMGGVFGAIVLLLAIVLAREFLTGVSSPTLFMLSLLGVATVGVVVKGDSMLGLASAMIGVGLAMIGGAPSTGEYRYTYDILYLYDGIPVVALALGLFALPEVMWILVMRASLAESATRLTGRSWDGFIDTLRNKRIVLQSSTIGMLVGSVPGLSGSISDWLAYGFAKQTTRNNHFGRGDVRGVIAPEAANNAKEGGSFIPTLILGIPGTGSMAVFLGAMLIVGIVPGPSMATQHLDVMLTLVWALAIANIVATGLCFGLAKYIARITLVPGEVVAPFLIIVFFVGVYQSSFSWGDMIAVAFMGLLGFVMKLSEWPRVPLIIGFVLGISLERYLHLSISLAGFSWLTWPTSLVIGALIAGMFVIPPFLERRSRARSSAPSLEDVE